MWARKHTLQIVALAWACGCGDRPLTFRGTTTAPPPDGTPETTPVERPLALECREGSPDAQGTVLAAPTDLYGLTDILADGTDVYFAGYANLGKNPTAVVRRVPRHGGNVQEMWSGAGTPHELRGDAGAIYFAVIQQQGVASPTIMRVSKSGGLGTALGPADQSWGSSGSSVSLAVEAGTVYVGANPGTSVVDSITGDGAIVRLSSGAYSVTSMAIMNGTLYWISGSTVQAMPTSGDTPKQLWNLRPFLTNPRDWYLSTLTAVPAAAAIYASGGDVITRVDGGGNVTTFQDGQLGVNDLAADDRYLYWSNGATGEIERAPLGGGASTVLASAQRQLVALAVDDEAVYWVDTGTRTVRRAPKSGLPQPPAKTGTPGAGPWWPTLVSVGADATHLTDLAVDDSGMYMTIERQLYVQGGPPDYSFLGVVRWAPRPADASVGSSTAAWRDLWTSTEAGAWRVATSATSVYFLTNSAPTGLVALHRLAKETNRDVVLARATSAAGCAELVVDGDVVYWVAGGSLMRVGADGSSVELAKTSDCPSNLLLAGGTLFWREDPSQALVIRGLDVRGGGAPRTWAADGWGPITPAPDGRTVYAALANGLTAIHLDDGKRTPITYIPGGIVSMRADAKTLYLATSEGMIRVAARENPPQEQLAPSRWRDIGSVRLQAGYLYWLHSAQGAVERLPACPRD